MKFDDVVAPLTRTVFLDRYWNASFLHMKGVPGRFKRILGWDELNTILEQHRLAPPRFKLFQGGHSLEPSRYMSSGIGGMARLDLGKLAACVANGATLVLDCVEELAPRVRELSASFQDVLRAGNYVNLYAGWHDQNGFDLHWDSQDAVILQLSGKKRWQIYAPTRLHPLQDDIEAPARPTGSPAWDGPLEEGDALYVPRGWWHVAVPLNEPSLHLTVATVQPLGIDLLRSLVENLRSDEKIRSALPLQGGGTDAAYLACLRKLVNDSMSDDVIRRFRREWEGDIRPHAHIRLQDAPYLQNQPVHETHRIRLAAVHRLVFVPNGGNVEFKAGGVLWGLPPDLVPALELLRDTACVPVPEMLAILPTTTARENLKRSLAALARAGVVLVEAL